MKTVINKAVDRLWKTNPEVIEMLAVEGMRRILHEAGPAVGHEVLVMGNPDSTVKLMSLDEHFDARKVLALMFLAEEKQLEAPDVR